MRRRLRQLLPVLAMGGLFVMLDVYQMSRAQSEVEQALKGRPISECSRENPCMMPSVEADICSLLARNRSFLGRSHGYAADFFPDRPCGRGGRYTVRAVAH